MSDLDKLEKKRKRKKALIIIRISEFVLAALCCVILGYMIAKIHDDKVALNQRRAVRGVESVDY